MLLVPLALSAPGGARTTGEEVVLSAGASDSTWSDEGHGLDGQVVTDVEADGVQAASVDEATSADEVVASPRPSTTLRVRSGSSPAGPAKATTAARAKRKTTTTTATAEPAAPPAARRTMAAAAAPEAKAAPAPAPAPPPPTTTVAPPPPPATTPAPAAGGGDSSWDRLAVCESSNTNDLGAPYYGYWQFSAETWRSVGEPGLPNEHSRAHQLAAAKRLQAARGWAPWPDCSRRLGLR